MALMRIYKPKAVLIEFLGVVTPEKWKQEVIIPHVKTQITDFLHRNMKKGEILIIIESLRASSRRLQDDDPSVPFVEEDTSTDAEVIETVVKFVLWQYNRGRLADGTRELESLVRRDGYLNKKLETPIYDDIMPSLQLWRRSGIPIYLDCPSLSAADATLIMSRTSKGDLRPFFKAYMGNEKQFMKEDSNESYGNMFRAMNTPAADILYLTHLGQRAKQITEKFGIECLLVDRSENRKVRSYYLIRFRTVVDLNEVQYVTRRSSSREKKV